MRYPRDLIVCCDGTNNTLTGGVADTNVVRLYEVLAAPDAPHRLMYYDRGVGAPDAVPPAGIQDWFKQTRERLAALASGRGVYENIARAYIFLMQNWQPGDAIFLFGFSRGAFTVRAVAGMVDLFGIIQPRHETMVPTLVNIYFSPPENAQHWFQRLARGLFSRISMKGQEAVPVDGLRSDIKIDRKDLAAQVQRMFGSREGNEAWVHWLGVWDTVESVGLPGPLSRKSPTDTDLSGKRIRHVRHALALDEHRWTFAPQLFAEVNDIGADDSGHSRRSLKQRWFPGGHCDVGGSYPVEESGLSETSLKWMLDELNGTLEVSLQAWWKQATDTPIPTALVPRRRLMHDQLWSSPYWALAGMTLRTTSSIARTVEVPPDTQPGPPVVGDIDSVWTRGRSAWALAAASLGALLCLVASGACLLPAGTWNGSPWEFGLDAISQASDFAQDQFASLWFDGLLADGAAPWERLGQHPGWAMVWDLAFIACYGYVLGRFASRAFTELAGLRMPSSTPPWWRWLGLAPLLVVSGDIGEDVLTLGSLAAQRLDSTGLGLTLIWLGSLGSLAKFVGIAATSILMGERYRLMFQVRADWLKRPRAVRPVSPVDFDFTRAARADHADQADRSGVGNTFALLVLALLLAAIWGLARATMCWGSYEWLGALTCNSHYLIGPMLLITTGLAAHRMMRPPESGRAVFAFAASIALTLVAFGVAAFGNFFL